MHINGIVTPFGPKVQAAITIKDLGISNVVLWFLTDTGSTLTRLSEFDWRQNLGVKPQDVVEMSDSPPIVTVSGTVNQWKIPCRTQLVLRGVNDELHVEDFPFIRVIRYPENYPKKEQSKLESIPSIMGRDIILKFRFVLTRKKVYMEKEDKPRK